MIGEAIAARIGEDEVVEQRDTEEIRTLFESAGELAIFFTG